MCHLYAEPIALSQRHRDEGWVREGRLPVSLGYMGRIAIRFGIDLGDRGQIRSLGNQIPDEAGQVIVRHEVPHRGGESIA
ncbi:MAG: hypothetical protein ACYCXT_03305 [Acidiferrobacteraceae bacterium]